jgi:hypothetical protein
VILKDSIQSASERGGLVAEKRNCEGHVVAPSSWQDWQRWVEGVDWPDWRSWLRRVASTDWASAPWPSTPWEQARQAGDVSLILAAWEEDEPGDQIGQHLTRTWPAFHQWWRDGANTRPTAGEARARLEEHMPELVPAWQQLTAMVPTTQTPAPRWRCGTRRPS